MEYDINPFVRLKVYIINGSSELVMRGMEKLIIVFDKREITNYSHFIEKLNEIYEDYGKVEKITDKEGFKIMELNNLPINNIWNYLSNDNIIHVSLIDNKHKNNKNNGKKDSISFNYNIHNKEFKSNNKSEKNKRNSFSKTSKNRNRIHFSSSSSSLSKENNIKNKNDFSSSSSSPSLYSPKERPIYQNRKPKEKKKHSFSSSSSSSSSLNSPKKKVMHRHLKKKEREKPSFSSSSSSSSSLNSPKKNVISRHHKKKEREKPSFSSSSSSSPEKKEMYRNHKQEEKKKSSSSSSLSYSSNKNNNKNKKNNKESPIKNNIKNKNDKNNSSVNITNNKESINDLKLLGKKRNYENNSRNNYSFKDTNNFNKNKKKPKKKNKNNINAKNKNNNNKTNININYELIPSDKLDDIIFLQNSYPKLFTKGTNIKFKSQELLPNGIGVGDYHYGVIDDFNLENKSFLVKNCNSMNEKSYLFMYSCEDDLMCIDLKNLVEIWIESENKASNISENINGNNYNVDIDEDLKKKFIKRQIEYYFSDSNYDNDSFLKSQADENGYIPIDVIMAFNKIKMITTDKDLFTKALKENENNLGEENQNKF